MKLALLLASALMVGGCLPTVRLHVTLPDRRCADGLPVKMLVGAACVDGVCGWTCAPDRWQPTEAPCRAVR